MPVRLGAASQQTFRLGAAPVSKMYLGAQLVYSPTSDPPPPPNLNLQPPVITSATAGNATATIAYTDRTTYTIVGRLVQQSTDGGLSWTTSTGTLSPSPAVVGSLTNGTPYRFRVATQTSQGVSGWSDPSAAVTPVGAPGTPRNVLIVGPSLTWSAPADLGGASPEQITYLVQRGTGTAPSITYSLYESVVGRTSLELPMSCSTGYWWRVAASTTGGQSAYSTAVYKAATSAAQPPISPTTSSVFVSPMATGIAVAWQNVGGGVFGSCDDPERYEVYYRPAYGTVDSAIAIGDGAILAGTVPAVAVAHDPRLKVYEFDLTGLDPSVQYRTAVRAVNAAGANALVQGVAIYAGAASLPPRPAITSRGRFGRRTETHIQTRDGKPDILEQTSGNFLGQWLDERYGYPIITQPCSDIQEYQSHCQQTCFCADMTHCANGAYFVTDEGLTFPGGGLERYRFVSSAGAGPWLYALVAEGGCDAPPPPIVSYIRGGKQSLRVTSYSNLAHLKCDESGTSPSIFNKLLEYRTATVGSDGLARGSGAWTPVDAPDSAANHLVRSIPQNSVLEVRLRSESGTAPVLGPPCVPVAVRTFVTGANLSTNLVAGLGATGSVLWDDPSSWTQPVETAPSTQLAQGRYMEVSRACVISLTATAPVVASPSATRRVSIVAYTPNGVRVGVTSSKSLAGSTNSRRLSFYAVPGRRYAVEVTDPNASTTAITNCYAQEHYDRNEWSTPWSNGGSSVCSGSFPVLRIETFSKRFALGPSLARQADSYLDFSPEYALRNANIVTYAYGAPEYYFRAVTDCTLHLRVLRQTGGIIDIVMGGDVGDRGLVLASCTSAQPDSGHVSVGMRRGSVVTLLSTSTTGLLRYAYADMRPFSDAGQAGDEFATPDAAGGGAEEAATQNGY